MKRICSSVMFLLLVGSLFFGLQRIYMPRWSDSYWNHGKIISGFYAEEPYSLDVIFLGSSQFMCGISPLELYERFGITSYNLATGEQDLILSYYWLRELLKTQKPKCIFLETMMLYQETNDMYWHMGVDDMHWGENKMKLIRNLSKDMDTDYFQYFLPLLYYHDRTDITVADFAENKWIPDLDYYLKGQAVTTGISEETFEGGFANTTGLENVGSEKEKYFLQIVKTCREEGIKLVLVKTPRASADWTIEMHTQVESYARKNRLSFLDYNDKALFEEAGFNSISCFQDSVHLNYVGASLLTKSLGEFLVKEMGMADWENDIADYEQWNHDLQEFNKFKKEIESN